jgi:inosine triphosphate pyrophosphatase
MNQITIVTGNSNKLKELQSLAPAGMKISSRSIDLSEIQSLNIYEIVEDKVRKAYKAVGGPVIVEDVSAGLDDLAGLPGPFYKFFREELGDTILVELAKISSDKITIICLAAYYDGKKLLYGEGTIHGRVVQPRGENGFGFDPIIVPKGKKQTMAEMTSEEKNKISHRGKAFRKLIKQL